MKFVTQISNMHENLKEFTTGCKMINIVNLSPTLISKALTKLLAGVKKLPKCPVSWYYIFFIVC